METLIKADIFFFISSIATVVLAILISVLLYYLIKAGKNLYMLTELFNEDFEESEEFINDLKNRLENNLVFRIFFPPLRTTKKHKVSKKVDVKDNNI